MLVKSKNCMEASKAQSPGIWERLSSLVSWFRKKEVKEMNV